MIFSNWTFDQNITHITFPFIPAFVVKTADNSYVTHYTIVMSYLLFLCFTNPGALMIVMLLVSM